MIALALFAAVVFVSHELIFSDMQEALDPRRDAWWPDPENEDKGLRAAERPYIAR